MEGDVGSALIEELEAHGFKYERNYPLSLATTIRIGGRASLVVWARDEEQLVSLIRLLLFYGLDFNLIGRGSNLIVDDRRPFSGVFIITGTRPEKFTISDNGVVEVYAGVLLPALIHKVATWNLGGLEFLAGVPGTVGGAVVMNAGPTDWGICDFLEYVDVLTTEGTLVRIQPSELEFGYRYCRLPVSGWIVKVGLKFVDRAHADIMSLLAQQLEVRRSKQPLDKPSAGSVFKNPAEAPAGYLIDRVGLKGYKVGGAVISDKHANFIVNDGGATFEDILTLMNLARKMVWEKFGVLLEPEVKVLVHPDLREVTRLWDVQ